MKIQVLALNGCSASEIGRELKIPRARVIRIARRKGITLAGAGGRRRVTFGVKNRYIRELDRLATMARVSRSVMAERLITTTLEDGGKTAIRLLGKLALPKRSYRPRASKPATEPTA